MKWIENYKSKLVTAEKAVSVVKSNQRVYVHPGAASPEVLLVELTKRYKELQNVEMIQHSAN